MNAVRKLIVSIFGIVIATATSILVLIKGWGLEPKSWWWIIGVALLGHILAAIIITISNYDEKKEEK